MAWKLHSLVFASIATVISASGELEQGNALFSNT
jgi:hypothetical protein